MLFGQIVRKSFKYMWLGRDKSTQKGMGVERFANGINKTVMVAIGYYN